MPDAMVPGCFDTAGPGRTSRSGGSGPVPTPVFCFSFGTPAGADLFAVRGPVTFPGLWMQISLYVCGESASMSRRVFPVVSVFMVYFSATGCQMNGTGYRASAIR
jgi:hypothetical protein